MGEDGGGVGVNPLLFSSLSCSRFEIPARPRASGMGRELHPPVTKGGIRPCVRVRTAQGGCFRHHPHRRAEATDREPLQRVLGTEVRMAQDSASGKGARFTGLIAVPSPDPSSSSSSVAAGGSCISSGKA